MNSSTRSDRYKRPALLYIIKKLQLVDRKVGIRVKKKHISRTKTAQTPKTMNSIRCVAIRLYYYGRFV